MVPDSIMKGMAVVADNVLVVCKQDINERGLQNVQLNRNYTCMSKLLHIGHHILGKVVKPDPV